MVDSFSPLRGSIALRPTDAVSIAMLGMQIGEGHDAREGLRWVARSAALEPGRDEFSQTMAALALCAADWQTAARSLRRCLAAEPQNPASHGAQARVIAALGPAETCTRPLHRAHAIASADAGLWRVTAALARQAGHLASARSAARSAVCLAPADADALAEAAQAELSLAQAERAERLFEYALAAVPGRTDLASTLALVHTYAASVERLLAAVRRHAGMVRRRRLPPPVALHAPDPARRLRVGYVSTDFRDHPVGHNLIGLVENHDHLQFDVTLYCGAQRPDAMTRRFAAAARLRSSLGLSDGALAEAIRSDGIDILVHVAGRFSGNRPDLPAYGAAPVQVAMHDATSAGHHGHAGTLTDLDLHPVDSSEHFVEPVIRIPAFYLFQPPAAPLPRPARDDDGILFGSANNPAKWSRETLLLWARILQRIPRARLWLKFHARTADPGTRRALAARLAEHGLPLDRVDFHDGDVDKMAHMAALGTIDIALDPFPFGGATASFEALWMGIPVVTMAGDRVVGRTSAMLLRHVGLADLVARDGQDYLAIALRLAFDRERLHRLRAELRGKLAASPLLDTVAHARSVEHAYRGVWTETCSRHQSRHASR